MKLDPHYFARPIAHRGLHDAGRGIIENTAAAFEAAIAGGYGIECDLRASADSEPFVFHDATLERLIDASGALDAVTSDQLRQQRYRGQPEQRILHLAELLDLIGGRVPLFIEIKSEWGAVNAKWLTSTAALLRRYTGPVAVMSFDAAVIAPMQALAPNVPRGLVSGSYAGPGWWSETLSDERKTRLKDCLEAGPAAPDFFAYEVDALPTPVMTFARHVMAKPVLTWTVRTAAQRAIAKAHADAMIFEGFRPNDGAA